MTSPHSVNVPSIRFKGFTDVWEECKLEEICNYYASSLSAKHINNEGIYDLYDANTIIGKTNTDCMKEDYITIIKDGAGVGRTRLLPKGSMFLGTMGAITPRNSNLDFLYQLVSNANLGSLYTGSTIPHIYFKDYGKNTYHVPHIVEQEQIGAFFYNIDHYITFYRYKYDKLQNIKKSMLEKMFPKNGSNIPEIRFAGFTDAWEQRKLDTITDVRDGTHDSPQYVETGHPFITSKNVKDGFINYEDIQYVSDKDYEEINKRSKVDKNDILMGMIGTIGNIALVRETPDFAIKNVALIKDIGDVYYRYLYHCLQSNSAAHQLDENLDGGTQKFIALNKIRELVIPVPSEHEQHKIGDYMESLDNLITLHQRRQHEIQLFRKISIFCTYADYF